MCVNGRTVHKKVKCSLTYMACTRSDQKIGYMPTLFKNVRSAFAGEVVLRKIAFKYLFNFVQFLFFTCQTIEVEMLALVRLVSVHKGVACLVPTSHTYQATSQ